MHRGQQRSHRMQYQHLQQRGETLPTWTSLAGVYLPSLLAFIVLDGIWIGLVASDFYMSRLKPVLKPTDPAAALLSWICIVAINYVFVLPRNVGSTSAFSSLGQGAVMGLLLYGTVDLTNCALIQEWSWLISLVDMAWGTTACAVTALVQVNLHAWLAGRQAAAAERGS